jgi:ATP-dependent Lon protease
MNLQSFKTFSADRMDIDELVALYTFGKSLRDEYEALQLEEPSFVDVQLKSLRREITARTADKLEARKRELTARIDSLKTPAQKKSELEKELAKLEEQLATA